MANVTTTTPSGGSWSPTDEIHSGVGWYSYCDRCGQRRETSALQKQRGFNVCTETCRDEPSFKEGDDQ